MGPFEYGPGEEARLHLLRDLTLLRRVVAQPKTLQWPIKGKTVPPRGAYVSGDWLNRLYMTACPAIALAWAIVEERARIVMVEVQG